MDGTSLGLNMGKDEVLLEPFSFDPCLHSSWQAAMHGSALTPRCPFDLPVTPSLTWLRGKNTNSEFCLPTCMGPASPQSQLNWFKLFNSKACLPPVLLFLHIQWSLLRISPSFSIFLHRCTFCSWSSDFYKRNRHFCPHPVGSSKGTQQPDWVLHWSVCGWV